MPNIRLELLIARRTTVPRSSVGSQRQRWAALDSYPSSMPIDFARAADYLLNESNRDQISVDLGQYFSRYTGRHFESFIARSTPDRFTAGDICAAATLSVPFTGSAVADLLVERAEYFNTLLNADGVPPHDADLRTVSEEMIADDSPLATLYTQLKSLDQVHYVRASKLLAAKRPGLVPIRDSVVEEFLGAGERWWRPYRELVTLDGLADRIVELSSTASAKATLLRRIDVALWMAGKRSAEGAHRSLAANETHSERERR